MEEFRSWVLTFRACLPIHRAIMRKFSDEFVFWSVASEFSLFKNTSKNIFEGPWSPSFRELVAFHEQMDGEKSDLGFLDS